MNKILSEIFEMEKVKDKKGNTYPLWEHNICILDGEFLQDLIKKYGSIKSLEIGFAFGISTLFICEALLKNGKNVKHIAIDPYQKEFYGIGIENIKRAGFSHIFEFKEEKSELYLPSLLRRKEKFDFIFIDGDHSFDHCFIDFFYCDRILSLGGIIVLDDINFPSIKKIANYISQKPQYKTLAILEYPKESNSTGKKMIAFQKLSDKLKKAPEPILEPEWKELFV